jgi:hypothetical protein
VVALYRPVRLSFLLFLRLYRFIVCETKLGGNQAEDNAAKAQSKLAAGPLYSYYVKAGKTLLAKCRFFSKGFANKQY